MDIREIKIFLASQLGEVEAQIDTALESDISLLNATNRLLREHPGKMMRPMLALLVADACGQPNENTYRYAAATELLHNATLMHDDVVDNARERRGQPTVAALLDNSAAVLVGDYWLVSCMQTVLKAPSENNRVLRLFADTLGHLAQGELLQMQKAQAGDTVQEDYLRIIYGKTASLFETAALSAAWSVGGPDDVASAMGEFARDLGIAFQIKDDIFDYREDLAALGKPVGIDLKEQKITQPLLCALEGLAPEEASVIREKVTRIADQPELAREVRAFVHARDGVQKATEVMESFIQKAIDCLSCLDESASKQYLKQLALFVGERNW